MSYSRHSRYSSRSPSPYYRSRYSRSLSRTPSRSRSRSRSWDFEDAANPGNNLYVTGLSPRISKAEIEDHFSTEGKVVDIHLVVEPYTRESRGFGFVTMGSIKEAERCIKYLDGSILEGRVISVEKAKRRRGRTPTPGKYLGLRTAPARRRSPSYSPRRRSRRFSSSDRERSYSPYYRRSPSPYRRYRRFSSSDRERSYSPYYRRSPTPYRRYRRSPVRRNRYYSPYSGVSRSRCRSVSQSVSRSPSPWVTIRSRRSCSRSFSSASRRRSRRSDSRRRSAMAKRRYSRESYAHSRSVSSHSRSVSSSSSARSA